MLKSVCKEDISAVGLFLQKHALGVNISCKMNAYGLERDFFKAWYSLDANGVNACISCFDMNAVICADDTADFEEIGWFLNASGFETVCGELSVLKKCGFDKTENKMLFRFAGEDKSFFDEVQNSSELKQIYKLISTAIPHSFPDDENAYRHFLSDFTFRQRRNLARAKAITENGAVVSCALTAAESENAAMISGVACNEACRGMGYGRKTVLTLANELKNEKKDVFVIALNDSAQQFYKKIGFEECITVGWRV